MANRREKGQAYELLAGREALTRLGDSSAAKTPQMGDSDIKVLKQSEEVQEKYTLHSLYYLNDY